MKAYDLDNKFDQDNEDVLDSFDLEEATRPKHDPKRVNVDFPSWMVQSLDKEASRLGVSRD